MDDELPTPEQDRIIKKWAIFGVIVIAIVVLIGAYYA